MRRSASKRAILAASAIALTALALPAIGQDAPESLLPPGFGDPAPAPAPTPGGPPAPGTPAAPPPAGPTDLLPGTPAPEDSAEAAAETDAEAEETEAAEADPFDLPPEARRSPDFVGVLTAARDGLGPDLWGGADGRYLSLLMRGTRAPVASRWASILLRRALLSQAPTPPGVAGADWVAERAWLLLRMGEADAARLLVAGVDVVDYTPKMFEVAQQVALANADPAALCPLAGPAAARSKEAAWDMARAMCAAMAGETGTASAIIDAARRSGRVRGIDLLLAEKVIGAAGGRRAINIEWDGVSQLTAWRFGLANAVNVEVPAPLFDTVGRHVRAWQARAPMRQPAERLDAATWAAALGVFSNIAYVDLIGMAYDATDPGEQAGTVGERLRIAYIGADDEEKMDALRALWDEPEDPVGRYARLVLTARAAARIAPDPAFADDAGNLIAAMQAAGLDYLAGRWAAVADGLDSDADAWAMLAVGAQDGGLAVDPGRVADYAAAKADDDGPKGALLVAALVGLGRLPVADANRIASAEGYRLGVRDSWTRAIDRAAARGEAGTVALLAATGMQTDAWRAVPPAYLMHMVAALKRVGREAEARMIAAEAIARA
jgi:hypothetical protein